MIISALKSNDPKDHRSPIHPDTISALTSLNAEVNFESGIGKGINSDDSVFENLGLKSFSRSECLEKSDLLITNQPISVEEISSMKKGSTLIGMVSPFTNQELINACATSNINLVSMEFIPRITRAQKMDVLSSQANLAGYAAVIESAKHLSTALPMMMTAAGTLKPARVFVIGVGVAGLQAMATAKRLGARVEAFDTRPAVEEQVKSLGARFIKIDIGETEETDQGYAKELTEKQLELQREGMKKVCGYSDIVITTAQVFGKPAPRILSGDMISSMQPGSVIVDMAVTSGGNVEGSVLGETVEKNGVKIIGHENLPGYVPEHSTQVYASNIYNLIEEFWDKDTKKLELDESDEILKSCIVTKDGNYISEILRR